MKLSLPKFILTIPVCIALSGGSAVAQDANQKVTDRTKALGAFAHLPKSTEGAYSVRDLNGMYDTIAESNFLKRILELSGAAGDESEAMIQQIREGLSTYAGEEVIVAYAKGSTQEVKRLMTLYDVYIRMTYGGLGRALGSGDLGSVDMDPEEMLELAKKQLKNPNSAMSKALESIQMPPILIGSKMGDAADGIVAQMDALEANLPPFVTVASFDVQGSEFQSWSINLKDVFDDNAQGDLEDMIGDKATSDRIAKAIRGKRIEFSFGKVGDHFVAGLGRNHAHLNFVEDPAESLASLPIFSKLDPYLGKPIHGLAYSKKELLEADNSEQMLKSMADSFVEGLSSGDSRLMKKIGVKVNKITDLMISMSKREMSDYVGIMYGGNGLNGESFGGWMVDSLDGKAKLTFANAGIDNAFMIFDNVSKEKYNEASIEMMETLASIVPLGAKVYGEMSGDEDSVAQFMEMQKRFAPKIEKIWNIAKNQFFAGLGQHSAIIVDLNGSLPKIPGVPRELVNKGKAPRIALAANVKDRKKLAAAWTEFVPAMNDLLAEIPGQKKGSEVQLPDALGSEKDGLTTHYFGMPFLSNDFMPSLSLSDKLFFLSTSKKFSESIAAKASKGSGDRRGIYLSMNFSELNKFASGWLQLVLKNTDTVFANNEFAAEDFEENSEMIRQALKIARVLKSFDYNKYTDDSNETRSSWHLRLKDVK